LVTHLLSLALFSIMSIHYGRLYVRFPTPLLLSIALSSVFLFQAQLSLAVTELWKASWWEYHVLLLAAFIVVFVGLAMEYKQSGTLDGVVAGLLVRNTIDQLQRGYTEVIVALVNAVEAKDVYTRGHTQRVTDLAARVSEELGLSHDRMRIVTQAAMLHDIGKIGVPDSILNKPGPLTKDEFAVIREHPVRGHEIIREVRSLRATLGGILHHHERMDGTGYPDGLAGEEIPLEARIIAVADVFDALTSVRSYRDAWSVPRALAEIDAQAGSRLDPTCVAALHRVLERERQQDSNAQRDRVWRTPEPHVSIAARSMAD
jgi:HD-GYP domain-containing protein (c-di-GMP phosphodiesterase class II)